LKINQKRLIQKICFFGFLFNEAEKGINDEEKIFDGHNETIHLKSFARKKAGRKPLPEHLPKEEIIHDIPECEKNCNCGHELKRIGEEVSDKLGYIPAKIYIERHIRFKYACKNCEGDERNEVGKIVVTAEMPPQILPKSNLTPELFVYILISKFLYHLWLWKNLSIHLLIAIHREDFDSLQDGQRWKKLCLFLG